MIDKQLLRLLGGNRKYIFFTVGSMVLGLLGNLTVTACICYVLHLAAIGADASAYALPAVCGAFGIGKYCGWHRYPEWYFNRHVW